MPGAAASEARRTPCDLNLEVPDGLVVIHTEEVMSTAKSAPTGTLPPSAGGKGMTLTLSAAGREVTAAAESQVVPFE